MPSPRIALFLGAGASVPYDKPTTVEFREELQDMFPGDSVLNSMLNSDTLPDIEYVLQAGHDILNHDKKIGGEYFRWLGELDDIVIRNHTYNTFIENVKNAISKLEKQIFSRYKWNSKDDMKLERLKNILDALFDINPYVYIFTTNYDTAVEKHCKDARLKIVDGFKHNERLRCYQWSGFSRSDYKMKGNCICLYKLHGSLNWIETDNGIEQVSLEEHDDAVKKFLIYPKLSTKLDVETHPYEEIWNEFKKIIGGVDILVVIGYSFRDERIAEIVREMVQNGMQLIVLSPNCGDDCVNLFTAEPQYGVYQIEAKFDTDSIRHILDGITELNHMDN